MELRQLRYFLAVATEANVTAASRRLNVSQPPLTRQIRQLETELGVDLFTRSSRGVQLTGAGAALLEDATRLVELADRASDNCIAASRGEIGRLDIGYFGSTIQSIVPAAVRTLQTAAPNVSVKLHRLSKADQAIQLRDRRIGIGFARYYRAEADLELRRVGEEAIYLATREDHPALGAETLTNLDVLSGARLILFPRGDRPSFADFVIDLLARSGVKVETSEGVEDVFAALALTSISDAVCFVPASVALLSWPQVRFSLVDTAEAVVPVHCLYLRHGRARVVDAFLQTMA